MRTTRRGALTLLAAAPLAGCGFRPLYMPTGGGRGLGEAELAAVFVPPIGERTGQLVRQALQQRLEGSGYGVQKRYELIASASIGQEAIGIQTDSSATRYRYNGVANWTLRKLDLAHTVLTAGSSRAVDGVNIASGQYFAADLESETVNRRVAEALADQIVAQVAIFLKRQATPPAS